MHRRRTCRVMVNRKLFCFASPLMYAPRRLPLSTGFLRAAPYRATHRQLQRSVSTGPAPLEETPRPGKIVPFKRLPPSPKYNHADFHRTTLDDIYPLRTDWENLPWLFFDIPWYWADLTLIEFYVKRIFGVHGDIHPVAFVDTCEPYVFFEAGGEYFSMSKSMMTLTRYGGAFTDPDDFLKRCASAEYVAETIPECDYYDETCDEQEDLYEKALRAEKRRLRKARVRARMVTA
ncbi:hypothetical protein C8R46DRAFT_242243 [Mycena filopes]|nr:hypothetical protein C8R46DRAFT_242243 [Mycena filopes]